MLNYHGLTREEGKEVLSFGEKNDVKTILQGAQQCSKIDYVFFEYRRLQYARGLARKKLRFLLI